MSGLVRGIGGTSVLLLAIVGLSGCGRDNRGAATRERAADEATQRDRDLQRQTDMGREGGHTIQNINKEPQNFYGKTVTVSGEVDKLLNPRAFQVSGEGMTNNDIIVITKKPLSDMTAQAAQLTEDARVQVTGTVRRFDMAAVEKEVGFDLDDKMFSDWRDKPVVIAESITITPAGQGGAGREQRPAGQGRQY